jgi:hypothetical protein
MNESNQVAPIRSKLSLIFSIVGIVLAAALLVWYLASYKSLSDSDFAEAGLVQVGLIALTGAGSLLAGAFALAGFLLGRKTGPAELRLKRLGIAALFTSGAFLSVHTISLGLYIGAVALAVTLWIFNHRYKSSNKPLINVAIVLAWVVVCVGIKVFAETLTIENPIFNLIFFTTL